MPQLRANEQRTHQYITAYSPTYITVFQTTTGWWRHTCNETTEVPKEVIDERTVVMVTCAAAYHARSLGLMCN